MRTGQQTSTSPQLRNVWRALSLIALGLSLIGCSSGSDPEPAALPVNPPPPPPAAGLPPLSATQVSLDDGHRVGSPYWGDRNTSDGGMGQDVDGLPCANASPNDYHAHTHLSIFLDGAALTIPQEVGFVALTPTTDCHYPLHTHNETGLIHIHGTEPVDRTLGQFFNIWGQPLESDNVGGLVGLPATVYIVDEDEVVTEYTGDLADIALISHRQITIDIGTPSISEIPNFTWSGE
jgi:hypothetical protein